MKKKKLHKISAGLLMAFVLTAGLSNLSEMTLQAQAQESVQRAVTETADLKFLSFCDESKLTQITVTEAQAAEMLTVVNDLIKDASNDYEKAQKIFKWVNENVEYIGSNAPDIQLSAQAYDVFTKKEAVCGGFSNLYNELLHLAGIPSVAVTGLCYDLAHQWNAVYAGGRWFYADTTGAGFDAPGIWDTHAVQEVFNATIELEGILLGYYHGLSVVGTKEPMKTLNIPDEYQGVKVTSISYQVFDAEYGVEVLNVNSNIDYMAIDVLKSASLLKEVNVHEDHAVYASREGVLFTKDMRELLAYPRANEKKKFTLPKETTVLDMKDAFGSMNLVEIEVEEGNSKYTSYDGALYNADMTELLFVPGGKTTVKIPANATINDMAFINFEDKTKITIYGTPGSYAEIFAGWYDMTFVDINEGAEPPSEEDVTAPGQVKNIKTEFIGTDLKITWDAPEDKDVVKYEVYDWLSKEFTFFTEDTEILLTNLVPGKGYNLAICAHDKAGNKSPENIFVIVVPMEKTEVVRIFGKDRFKTSYEVANKLKEALGVKEFKAAVVATGLNFADALSESYLAVKKEAPILLTDGTPGNVAELCAYIKENVETGATVYILGGTGAVSQTVEEAIQNISGIRKEDVKRLKGSDRYKTNIAILNEAGITEDTILVATGDNFADSLSASASKLPILLVGKNAVLNKDQKALLAGRKNICILGGTGAVSDDYVSLLEEYGVVERVSGSTRYDTSVKIAEKFCEKAETIVVAVGKNGKFADGLCGGPLAAAMNVPLVLTEDDQTAAAAKYVTDNKIAGGYVLGGKGALSNSTVVTVFGLQSEAEIK